jgi:uncharacterized damage-inducible protein DinB
MEITMSERKRLLDLVDRAYKARAWHGPAVLETLEGVTPAVAAKHPLRGAHSIWELVEHVASWNEIVAKRLEGGAPVVTQQVNFPRVPRPTPAAWKATLRRLARTQARFRRAVAAFPVAKLGRRRAKTDQTWNVLIHGQIQHMLYHAGQIALMRRGLGRPIRQ